MDYAASIPTTSSEQSMAVHLPEIPQEAPDNKAKKGKKPKVEKKPIAQGRVDKFQKYITKYALPIKTDKVHFECPNCRRQFPNPVIQRHNCVNIKGEKCTKSGHEVRLVRVEMCRLCFHSIRSTQLHFCGNDFDMLGVRIKCMNISCELTYDGMKMFDKHVQGMHSQNVLSMFFSNYNIFMDWKGSVEEQTKVTFIMMNKRENKQYYRCTHSGCGETEDITCYCPATIVTQDNDKGIQAHFYPHHFGHDVKLYRLPEQYEKYSLSLLLKQ